MDNNSVMFYKMIFQVKTMGSSSMGILIGL